MKKLLSIKKMRFDRSKHDIYNHTLHSAYSELDCSEYLLIVNGSLPTNR